MGAATQRWEPGRYARHARFVSELGRPLVDLLDPRPGERILDLGCGDGALSVEIAARGARVTGLDASPEQVAAARGRGVDATTGDGQALAWDGAFEGVFSNAALHWMPDMDAVIDGVWRALAPGGRFVGEMGGDGNVRTIETALVRALDRRGHDGRAAVPWIFPTVEDYRRRLEARGFRVACIGLRPRPTPLPGGLSAWLETFAGAFLAAVPPDQRAALAAEVETALRPVLADRAGRWTADYVRLRFRAEKPA